MPVDLMFPDPISGSKQAVQTPPTCGPEYVEYLRKVLQTSYRFARDHLHQATIRQKKGYDAHAKDRPQFNIGDFVRYYYPPSRQTNKFARPWIGPFQVVERTSTVDYKIQLVSDPSKTRVVHIDNLKPYETPYSKVDIESTPDELGVLSLDDHPEHLDPPVDDLETVAPSAPETLQTKEAMLKAHRRLRSVIKPPKRYGFDDEDGNKTNKTKKVTKPKMTNTQVVNQPPNQRTSRRTAKLPSRYRDFCLNYSLFSTPLLV